MSLVTALIAGAGLGLASSFHCAAMCGLLVGASCARRGAAGAPGVDGGRAFSYTASRAVGYTLVGAMVGALGAPIAGSWQAPVRIVAAALAAFVIARAGVRMMAKDRAGDRSTELVTLQTKAPARRAFPPALLGLATAVFPCGALLSGLVLASASGGAVAGATTMAAFALASAPGLLLAVVGATSMFRRFGRARRLLGAAMIAVAGLTVFQAAMAVRPSSHGCCHAAE